MNWFGPSGDCGCCDGDCCTILSPSQVTLSGAGSCFNSLNGTFALSNTASCVFSYLSQFVGSPGGPADPCGSDSCYFDGTYHWAWKRKVITLTLAASPNITGELEYVFQKWLPGGGGCAWQSEQTYIGTYTRSTCDVGALTFDSDNSGSLSLPFSISPPTSFNLDL